MNKDRSYLVDAFKSTTLRFFRQGEETITRLLVVVPDKVLIAKVYLIDVMCCSDRIVI